MYSLTKCYLLVFRRAFQKSLRLKLKCSTSVLNFCFKIEILLQY